MTYLYYNSKEEYSWKWLKMCEHGQLFKEQLTIKNTLKIKKTSNCIVVLTCALCWYQWSMLQKCLSAHWWGCGGAWAQWLADNGRTVEGQLNCGRNKCLAGCHFTQVWSWN